MTGSDEHADAPLPPTVAFPPVPMTTDPQRPASHEDALEPDVPTYAAPEPMPDPAPSWLISEGGAPAAPSDDAAPLIDVSKAADGGA